MTSPYVDNWEAYLAAGWSPFPLPEGRKAAPPTGWTGIGAPRPDYKTCWGWADDTANEAANIGVRVPDDVLGIDVDTYGPKRGDLELEAKIATWGPLPPTWRSSARDDPRSGVLVYRVPPGLRYPSQLGRDIELLRPGHRYAVVEPSVRYDDETVAAPAPQGAVYRWTHPDVAGDVIGQVPNVADLPELPAAWVEGLTAGVLADGGRSFTRVAPPAELAAWRRADAGQPCPATQRLAASLATGLTGNGVGSRHDALVNGMVALTRHGQEGHTGIPAACGVLAEAFRVAMTAPGSTRRYDPHEVDSATAWAVGALVGDRARMDPCSAAGGVGTYVDTLQRRRGAILGGAAVGAGPGSSTGPSGQAVSPSAPAVPTDEAPAGGDPFPLDALPPVVQDIVTDVCRATGGLPWGMAGPHALAVLSAALQGRAWVNAGSLRTLATLYTITVAPPAARKSSVHGRLTAALYAAQDAIQASERVAVAQTKNTKRQAVKRADDLEKAADAAREKTYITPLIEGGPTAYNLANDIHLADEAARSAAEARAHAEMLPDGANVELSMMNATPEALVQLAGRQGGSVAILASEGELLRVLTGSYGKTVQLDPLLNGSEGERLQHNRVNADPVVIPELKLTLALMMQPSLAREFTSPIEQLGRTFRQRGLTGRILWSWPASVAGETDPDALPPDEATAAAWATLVRTLAEGARSLGPVDLHLTPEAAAACRTYDRKVTPDLTPEGVIGSDEAMQSWGSRRVALVLRVAAICHAAQHPTDWHTMPVDLAAVLGGIAVVQWAQAEAIRILLPAEAPSVLTRADAGMAVGELLAHSAVAGGGWFALGDVWGALDRRYGRRKAGLRDDLAALVQSGRLDVEEVRPKGGGRPALRYRLVSGSADGQ